MNIEMCFYYLPAFAAAFAARPWRTPFAELSRGFRAWRFCFRGGFPTWTRILNLFMEAFGAAQVRSSSSNTKTHPVWDKPHNSCSMVATRVSPYIALCNWTHWRQHIGFWLWLGVEIDRPELQFAFNYSDAKCGSACSIKDVPWLLAGHRSHDQSAFSCRTPSMNAYPLNFQA